MSAASNFEFTDPGPLIDEDLELVLVRKNPGNPSRGYVPSYDFAMRKSGETTKMGNISLRIGHTEQIEKYAGHIGYGVVPRFRGNRYAARGCRLLFPLALRHGINPIWITCNPDNIPSRRTCELVRAEYIETVPLPESTEMYRMGERFKCRYRIDL